MRESSISGPLTPPGQTLTNSRPDAGIWWIPLAASAALVVLKLLLISRININWDEFLFLSHVHSLVRGDLGSVFQTAYTHLFTWLPALGDEMTEIIVARW